MHVNLAMILYPIGMCDYYVSLKYIKIGCCKNGKKWMQCLSQLLCFVFPSPSNYPLIFLSLLIIFNILIMPLENLILTSKPPSETARDHANKLCQLYVILSYE